MRIEQLIQDEDFNSAFEIALTAADLQLVLWTCQRVDPVELFNPSNGSNTALLTQPTILSIIQQLSQNLNEDTEIKTRFVKKKKPTSLKILSSKAIFPLGEIFRAQRKTYCFSSNSAKSVRWKVGSSSTFPPPKIPQTNHIAHFAYHMIKTIAAPYGWFRLVENRLKKRLVLFNQPN